MILREGLVIETDETLFEAAVYFHHYQVKVGSLLVAEAV